jgi:Flp pilus assembly protein TadG
MSHVQVLGGRPRRLSIHTRRSRRLERALGGAAASRRRPGPSRGQALIIFALTFSVLIGILGLAIDTVRVYDLYARMVRAAEAGALAGVIYMPNSYTTNLTYPPGDTAVCRAMAEVVKNGFGTPCVPETAAVNAATACPGVVSTVEVAVCPVAGKSDDLVVYVTETLNLVFLSAMGFGPLTITARGQSEFLPPVQIGTNDASGGGAGNWGGLGECTSYTVPPVRIDCDDTLRSFAANIAGPAELKEWGDAFVNCEEGQSYVATNDPSYSLGPPYTTYNGLPTNHAQYGNAGLGSPHCGAGNPDQQSFSGPATQGTAHPGGYAFYVHVSQAGANLWIYNAPFNPASPPDCTNEYPLDSFHWYCNGNTPVTPANYFQGSNFSTQGYSDPNLYYAVTYSIYSVPDLGNPSAGTLLGSYTALPYDSMSGNGCGGSGAATMTQLPSSAYGINSSSCVTPKCTFQWCAIPAGTVVGNANTVPTPLSLPVGDYRVMVEATSYTQPSNFDLGWGQHIFNFKVCPGGSSRTGIQTCYSNPNNPPGVIGGWTATSVMFVNTIESNCEQCIGSNYPLGLAEFPLGIIPVQYAGLTLDIKFYNPGGVAPSVQTAGDVGLSVVPPVSGSGDPCSITPQQLSAYSYSFPAWERWTTADKIDNNAQPIPMLFASKAGDRIYAGLWTDLFIKVPINYVAGQWTLCTWATARQQSRDDPYSPHVMTVKITALGQSPVHLVP